MCISLYSFTYLSIYFVGKKKTKFSLDLTKEKYEKSTIHFFIVSKTNKGNKILRVNSGNVKCFLNFVKRKYKKY